MILSRMRPLFDSAAKPAKKKSGLPTLEDFLQSRDYTGAITLLEFHKRLEKPLGNSELWIAYCAFHLGDFKKAFEIYIKMTKEKVFNEKVWLFAATCLFYMGVYDQAKEIVQKGPNDSLKTRLEFHLAFKLKQDVDMVKHHAALSDSDENKICVASLHYLRGHYHEAASVYKHLLAMNKEYIALNVYIALCYYKMDYFDVAQEVLSLYLQHHPDSMICVNLKCCNQFRLFDGKAAESELKKYAEEKDASHTEEQKLLIKHNLTVFRNGEGAIQVFSPLIDVIHEARLNLAVYHMSREQYGEGYNLLKDFEPSSTREYVIKAVACTLFGQWKKLVEPIRTAENYFQIVGKSQTECDTISGRQCMASYFFLSRQFEDSLFYFNTIKNFLFNDDTFNYNYGQAKAACKNYREATEIFNQIQNERVKMDPIAVRWLAKCYVRTKRPQLALELYNKIESMDEGISLLTLVANECYKTRQYYVAMKAFDMLERLKPQGEYWVGKRGACVGVFLNVVTKKEPRETLNELLVIIRNSSNPQVEYIIRAIKRWMGHGDDE